MKSVLAQSHYLLLRPDGSIHYSFSKFLTEEFDNSNTRELVGQSLRVLYQFCHRNQIELALRANVNGKGLTYDEVNNLVDLCYRPLSEIEKASSGPIAKHKKKRFLHISKNIPGAVEPNTARRRLQHIAQYLMFFSEVFLEPCIRNEALRKTIHDEYEKSALQLRGKISGTKQNHHHDIQSLPAEKFLEIVKVMVLEPEKLFITASGKQSRTMLRDRAIALLACEGLRPGTIGNVAREDLRQEASMLVIKDNRHKRSSTSSSTPFLKLGDSTRLNSASETKITLWPVTLDAIANYIEEERSEILTKRLKNSSRGFLFLSEKGGPIKHRSALTGIFKRLGKRLAELGFLDVGSDPYFRNQKRYDFYGYVLRHSSASLFVERSAGDQRSLDSMKSRYGWTMHSKQPERYAARALSDLASIDLMEFNKDLLSQIQNQKKIKQANNAK